MKTIPTLLLLILLAGCATAGRQIDQSKFSQIERGKTTRDQVKVILGEPQSLSMTSDGNTAFTYWNINVSPNGAAFIPLVGMFAGGPNIEQQTFMVTFGPDHTVKDFYFTQSKSSDEPYTGPRTKSPKDSAK